MPDIDAESAVRRAGTPDAPRGEAEVRATAVALSDAIVSNDPARIGAYLAEKWRLVDADGITTRQDFLEVVASGRLTHSEMRASGEIDVQVYGSTAVVLARVVNTARFDGEVFEADEWTTDVFVRDDAGWRCVHSHVTAADDARRG
ncbi:nuclear transport factor 2 family protein [Microbacterium sp. CFH 90308]|uniref:Nuclear transport factor 2 family protein n=1 Tax=Microbacterium salsuginis TaxID=2722803 RepID=A0ABX1K6W0_9MICO|nr:nuclear transport factor 2 family protein [Microbacterium sp. CFH 90308]NLP82754.1 nuclear transport factor 2 family protein [Microbacterium sp. CFH 90308]